MFPVMIDALASVNAFTFAKIERLHIDQNYGRILLIATESEVEPAKRH